MLHPYPESQTRLLPPRTRSAWPWMLLVIGMFVAAGCGTTTQRTGTEQLLMSDAVDMAVAQIDFSSLSRQRVFLDTSYLQSVKGMGFVNAPYIISSLRQQLTAAGCLLQDDAKNSDVVVEARVGALGTDGHEVIYGIPENNLLNSAVSFIPNAPTIPALPEMSAARVDAQSGIAKLMVFAYDAESRQPIWQSGVARAESNSRSSWILGAGPFQRGTVHDGTRFAGEKFETPLAKEDGTAHNSDYFAERQFNWTPPSSLTDDEPTEAESRVASKPDDESGNQK